MPLTGVLDKTQGGRAPQDAASTTRRYLCTYTGPSSYVQGGDPGLAAALGIGKVFAVAGMVAWNGTIIAPLFYNPLTDSLLWFAAAGTEQSPGAALNGYTAYLEVIGQ